MTDLQGAYTMQDEDILQQGMDMLDGNVLAGSKNNEKNIEDYARNTDYRTALDAYYTAICAQLWLSMKEDPNMYGDEGAKRILGFKRILSAGATYGPSIKKHLKQLGCKVPPGEIDEQSTTSHEDSAPQEAAQTSENTPPSDTDQSNNASGDTPKNMLHDGPTDTPNQAQTSQENEQVASPAQDHHDNNAAQEKTAT